MQAERERRKQILDTQALVNVAEGHKQRTILESEGGTCMSNCYRMHNLISHYSAAIREEQGGWKQGASDSRV